MHMCASPSFHELNLLWKEQEITKNEESIHNALLQLQKSQLLNSISPLFSTPRQGIKALSNPHPSIRPLVSAYHEPYLEVRYPSQSIPPPPSTVSYRTSINTPTTSTVSYGTSSFQKWLRWGYRGGSSAIEGGTVIRHRAWPTVSWCEYRNFRLASVSQETVSRVTAGAADWIVRKLRS